MFQSTPLREGRLRQCAGEEAVTGFNPRPCARGDPASIGLAVVPYGVSIHAPARGATGGPGRPFGHSLFQSTPLREGRPGLC